MASDFVNDILSRDMSDTEARRLLGNADIFELRDIVTHSQGALAELAKELLAEKGFSVIGYPSEEKDD